MQSSEFTVVANFKVVLRRGENFGKNRLVYVKGLQVCEASSSKQHLVSYGINKKAQLLACLSNNWSICSAIKGNRVSILPVRACYLF